MIGGFSYLASGLVVGGAAFAALSGASAAASELSPLDYPLSGVAAQMVKPSLPVPTLPPGAAAPADIAGPRADQRPAPPSPLLGKMPPLPLSKPFAERLKNDPALLEAIRAHQKPVQATKAAPPPAGGAWSLGSSPAGSPNLSNPLLMTDGTVIAYGSCTGMWWKLTPDYTGSYANGTWVQIASLPSGYTPRFFSSAVLPDGRVVAEGGEYNTTSCTDAWTSLGAVYDPLANAWTSVDPPAGWSQIGDAQSMVLPGGTYMQSDCCDFGPFAAELNASTLSWTSTGSGKFDLYDEEGWTLLPNGKVMTVDAYVQTGECGRNSELYSPATGAWTSAGNTPAQLADCANPGNVPTDELGPGTLRPDGTVVVFGGTTCGMCAPNDNSVVTRTAIYNSGNATWSAGPNLPAAGGFNQTLADAPAATLPSGNVLFATSPNYAAFSNPTNFFELGFANNTIAAVAAPTDAASFNSFQWNFLDLPNGQVMALETDGSNVWYYTPTGGASAAWAPSVTSVPSSLQAGATYQLAGTQFNGLSQGAVYGDDVQAATDYPIIKIVNSASGHVAYARSFGFTVSMAAKAAGSTSFTMPQAVEPGPSSLYVVANGVASAPVSVGVERSLYAKAPDFNADGHTDVLWRNADGAVVIWEVNGSSRVTVGGQEVNNGWSIAGTGDFNADGHSDILWRNRNGEVVIWEMNGGTPVAYVGGEVVGNAWSIVGTGDFFGTGHPNCILWRNFSTGANAIWEMNGGAVAKSVAVPTLPAGWEIVGLGDFNTDGKTDILWRDAANGEAVIWEMNGGAVSASILNKIAPSGWFVAGTGDFNGDGHTDILWRTSAGAIEIWEMNGGTVLATVGGQTVAYVWQVVGTGDYFGAGHPNCILWRQVATGAMTIWEMNGGVIAASANLPAVAPSTLWSVVQ